MKTKKPAEKSRNQLADETHTWIDERRHLWQFCKMCMTVRRADRRNKPCKGPIKITMRSK